MVERVVVGGRQVAQTRNEHEPVLVRRAEQASILSWLLARMEVQVSIERSPVLLTEAQGSTSTTGGVPVVEPASCSFLRAPKVVQETWAVARVV